MTILIVQMAQISNMKAIGLMVDNCQILSIEFYGEWQKVASLKSTDSFHI